MEYDCIEYDCMDYDCMEYDCIEYDWVITSHFPLSILMLSKNVPNCCVIIAFVLE